MENRTPVNIKLVEDRMNMPFSDYLQKCIDVLDGMQKKSLLDSLGEFVDDKMKTFIRNKLRSETITLLRFYKEFPIET